MKRAYSARNSQICPGSKTTWLHPLPTPLESLRPGLLPAVANSLAGGRHSLPGDLAGDEVLVEGRHDR